MTEVHPRWRSTGEETEAHSSTEPARVPVRGSSASRLPGAVIGILSVLALLLSFSGLPLDFLRPQAKDTSSAPESTVAPPAVVQKEKSSRPRAPRLAAQAAGEEEVMEELGTEEETDPLDEEETEEDIDLPLEEDLPDESVPRNPYTVSGGADRMLDPYGRPLDYDTEPPLRSAADSNPLADAPDFMRQPQSGADAWIVFAGSLAAMAYLLPKKEPPIGRLFRSR